MAESRAMKRWRKAEAAYDEAKSVALAAYNKRETAYLALTNKERDALFRGV